MKKLIAFILLFSSLILSLYPVNVSAQQTQPKAVSTVDVTASVGQFNLDVSGLASPFASVVMTADKAFIRSTTADKIGNFSISSILIKKGFSGFCLTAVDFKRVGESYKCFSFPPATESITMKDIFLPPTLGILRNELNYGSIANTYGYTMPGSIVTLHVNTSSSLNTKVLGASTSTYDVKSLASLTSKQLTAIADSKGYYKFDIENLQVGDYSLYSKAKYKNKTSLTPDKMLMLKMLSLWEQLLAYLRELWHKILVFLVGLPLGPLWLAIPLIILIIILILKLWPERFSFIYESRMVRFITRKKKKKMHHAWFIGY